MKIKTRKMNSYPGDKTIQIFVIDKHKQEIGLMNLEKKYCNGYIFYKTDRISNIFNSITEAKQYCKDNMAKLLWED